MRNLKKMQILLEIKIHLHDLVNDSFAFKF